MARTLAAMKAGRLAWIARMQELKALGIINRLPTGPRSAARTARERAEAMARMERAVEVVERLLAASGRS